MKKKLRIIIGSLVILTGLGFVAYPIINNAYASYQQSQLMDEIKAMIKQNMQQGVRRPDTGQADGNIAEEFQALALEMTDNNNYDMITSSDRLSGQTVAGIIEIPAIDLIYAIVEGVEAWNIGVAIGHFKESAPLGAEGNSGLAGHRGGISGPYFRDLDQLASGDKVMVTDAYGGEYTYTVIESFVVEPTQTEVVMPLGKKGKFLTMITCTDNGTRRLVVRAQLKDKD